MMGFQEIGEIVKTVTIYLDSNSELKLDPSFLPPIIEIPYPSSNV